MTMEQKNARRWWVLGALSFALLAVGLDMTVLNIALPTLATALDASTGELQWFADAYNLVLAALLLPAGMLGDRFGRKKMLLIALVLFGIGSVGCAFSTTAEMLIGMRAVLGVGAAFLIPLSMSILPVLFGEEERTKATTIWATSNMLGIPLGPIVGGWLLKHYEWGSVFLLNLPFVVVGLFAIAALMPESRSGARSQVDLPGVLTSSAGLIAITFGVIRAGENSWSDGWVLISLAAGIAVLTAFVLIQRRSAHPLIDLSLFRSASFTWGSVLATVVSFAMFGLLFAIPLYYQAVKGYDTFGTGLRLLPMIGGLLVGARASDKLVQAVGRKGNLAAGFLIMAAGLAVGAATAAGSSYGFAALWITVAGIGLGMTLPTSMDAALGELTAERSGVGSALIMAMRQVGASIGIAILGAVLNAGYRGGLTLEGLPAEAAEKAKQSVSAGVAVAAELNAGDLLAGVRSAFVHGMDGMLVVCAGLACAGIALALFFMPRGKPAGAADSQAGQSQGRALP